MLKIFALTTVVAIIALGAPSAQAQKTTLTVASFPDLDRAAKAALSQWKKLHPDIEIKLVSRQYPDHHTAMTTALATGSGLPDVMAVDFRFIGKFAESSGLEDLSKVPYNGNSLRGKFVRFSFPQATSTSGALAAIPVDIGPGTLLYRKDILDRAGLREEDLTRSWESFIEAGKKIKSVTGVYLLANAADIRDIALRSGLSDGEGVYFDSSGNCLIESVRFVRAFELGRAARVAGIDARAVAWTNEWAAGFKNNRIASQMMGAWLAGHLKNWLAPDSKGLWRSTTIPGGVYASYGGSFYAIPKKAANKNAAWEFILLLAANREVQLQSLRVLDSFPALTDAYNDPAMDEPIEFLGGQQARRLWRTIAGKIPAIAVNKHDAMAQDIMNAEFEKVLAEGKSIPSALADARALVERRARR